MKLTETLVIILFFAAQCVYGEEVPPVVNFSNSQYRAHKQNWGVDQGAPSGFMYVANSDALLEFDGATWKRYPLPNGQITRSVKVVDKRVFVGGFGEFGYWTADRSGVMRYQSLSRLVQDESYVNEEIWHILSAPDGIYFQSFSKLFRFDGKKVIAIRVPGNFMFMRLVNGRKLIPVIGKGIFDFDGKEFRLLRGTGQLLGMTVVSITPWGNKDLLIATERNGFFVWSDGKLSSWDIQIATELKWSIINKVSVLKNGNYAIGTIQSGVFILTPSGNLLYHFRQENGLQNNTVLSLCEDERRNLWVGLDSGISCLQLHSPLLADEQESSRLGTVYSAALWENRLYLASNVGVFSKPWPSKESFKPVRGLQGQTWELRVLAGELLCGHSEGTFSITRSGVRRISEIKGGWCILPISEKGERIADDSAKFFIQGTYAGLHLFALQDGKWEYRRMVKNVPPIPIKQIVNTGRGVLWMTHAYKGLYRAGLSPSLDSVVRWTSYTQKSGLNHPFSVDINSWLNSVIIKSGTEFLRPAGDQLVAFSELDSDKGQFKVRSGFGGESFRVYADKTEWYTGDSLRAAFNFGLVRNNEQVILLSGRYYLFCLDNGYALLDRYRVREAVGRPVKTEIRSVSNLLNSASLLPLDSNQQHQTKLRDLRFSFSCPFYGSDISFRYRLKGQNEAWSEWTPQTQADFTNLASGSYAFEVQNSLNRSTSVYEFAVLPYFYETWWFKLLGAFGVIMAVWGLLMAQSRQMAVRQLKIRRQHEEELQRQKMLAERQIMEIENRQLHSEVRGKSQQLSNIAINVVRKNEILEEIRSELVQVKREMGLQLPNIHYQKLLDSIDRNASGKEDWKLFEDNFDEVHEEFFKRAKDVCPSITPTELKLAAALRMNLSSKEIAPILGISIRGVEIKRYRLRRKLGLNEDVNLAEYMMEL